jgi:hypothetical protein
MFLRKVLGRTIAATATTGLLVAPLALTTAPQMMNVACVDNPEETIPTLALDRPSAQYGTKTLATATVPRELAGEVVTFSLTGPNRSQSIAKRVREDGRAQWLLPRGLVADRSYEIVAQFDTCDPSVERVYSVEKATSKPAPRVVNARKATFRTTVAGGGGLAPDAGPARFTVRKKGSKALIRDQVDYLDNGVAAVNFKNLKRGRYVLKVTYEGNRNFEVGSTSRNFRVR